ncbi:hypothetical protein BDR22DRAFT_883965 [Usnea florida]
MPKGFDEMDDKIPAGKQNWTGVIEVRTTITVRKTDRAPTAPDHDMNLPEEPAETAASANIETNPVESFDGKKAEVESFNLLGLSDKVLEQVLLNIFESEEEIKPFWNFDALEVPPKVACNENIFGPVLVAFAGNKRLMDLATKILYNDNLFELRDAKVSLWWLRRIGSNISKLRYIRIFVGEGVVDSFGTRSESLWLEIILLLKAKSNLMCLDVDFAGWTGDIDGDDGLNPATSKYILEPRRAFVRTLLTFRNIYRTIMKPGVYMPKPTINTLRTAVVMLPGQTMLFAQTHSWMLMSWTSVRRVAIAPLAAAHFPAKLFQIDEPFGGRSFAIARSLCSFLDIRSFLENGIRASIHAAHRW